MELSYLPNIDCLYLRETRCCGIRIFWFLLLIISIIFDCFFAWIFHIGMNGSTPIVAMLFSMCTAIIFMIMFAIYLDHREYKETKSIDDVFPTSGET